MNRGLSVLSKELIIVGVFFIVACFSLIFSFFLPNIVPDDEYVVLLSEKVSRYTSFPDQDILKNYSYSFYFYPKLVGWLGSMFEQENYRAGLLFVLVFLTGYFAYIALRLAKFSRKTSVAIAIVALFPRVSVGNTFWGIFTPAEVMGRTLAMPLIWILSGWHIRNLQDEKSSWPIFAVLGLVSFVHPVSMTFFACVLMLSSFLISVPEFTFFKSLKSFFMNLFSFSVTAAPLWWEIFHKTSTIAQTSSVNSVKYLEAILFRIPWDFLPESVVWLRHILIISLFFLFFLWVKREALSLQKYKTISLWIFGVATFSVVLSFVLPTLQFWAIKFFDAPLIFQQASRIFIYYYVALFVASAICLDYFLSCNKFKKIILFVFLIIGCISSSFGFEIGQFLVGYQNYERAYVPVSWQRTEEENDRDYYSELCSTLTSLGANQETLTISTDFKLRYFCELPLYVTFEEGGAYLNAGRSALVEWHSKFEEQQRVIKTHNIQEFLVFAKKVDARYAVLHIDSFLVTELKEKGYLVAFNKDRAIITLRGTDKKIN